MSGWSGYGDEIEKYKVAQSIVERQELAIRPTAMYHATGVDNRNYSTYELGQSIFQVPFYALGKIVGNFFPQPDVNWIGLLFVGLANPLLTALTCLAFYHTGLALGYRARVALVLTLALGLGTIIWPYSRGLTREPLLTFLILLCFYTTCRFAKTNHARWLALAGLLTGYLVFTKFLQAIVIPFFLINLLIAVYQTLPAPNRTAGRASIAMLRAMGLYFSPILVFLIAQGLFSWLRFGSLTQGLSGLRLSILADPTIFFEKSNPLAMLHRLLFSPDKSIFVYSPLTLLFGATWWAWFKKQGSPAFLALGLILSALLVAILRFDGDGGSWWGPRYVVQIIPLLILPLGMLDTPTFSNRVWKITFGALVVIGVLVQLVGVLTSDRAYLDATGNNSSLLGQIDFLRHGALDSLILYLSPNLTTLQINPFGILLIALAVGLGMALVRQRDAASYSAKSNAGVLAILLAMTALAFIGWVVAPYQNILAGKGNTRFIAAENFLADQRPCEATGLYVSALELPLTFQRQAIERYQQLAPRAPGKPIPIDDPMRWIDIAGDAHIENDPLNGIGDAPALRFQSAPTERAITATITSGPIAAQPNTRYELAGWVKSASIYGTGSGGVSIFEDNGNWGNPQTVDILNIDETHGWQPFRQTITTTATTQRFFVKIGLFNTWGTLWVDGIQLTQVDNSLINPPVAELACQK